MRVATLGRWGGLAAMLGGALWVPYGVFEMLAPWGEAIVYREDLGYEVVADASLYRVYSLPGGLAALLSTLGLLGTLALLGLPAGRSGRVGRILTYGAVGLSALSLLGGKCQNSAHEVMADAILPTSAPNPGSTGACSPT